MDGEALSRTKHQSPLEHLRRLLSAYRPDIWTVVLYAAFVGLLTLVTPVAVQSVVNTTAFGTLLQPLFVLVALLAMGLVLSGVLRALKTWSVEVLQRRMFIDTMARLAHLLPRVDWDRAHLHGHRHVIHRYFDLFTVQKTAASLLLGAVDVVLAAVVGLLVLAFYHPLLLAFDAVLLIAVSLIVFGLGRGGVRTAVHESTVKYEISDLLAEVGKPSYAVRDAGGAVYVRERLDALSESYLKARAGHFRVVMRQFSGALLTQAVASAALLGLGGWLVIQRELTLGQLVAAEIIVTNVVTALSDLGKHIETYYDLVTSTYKLDGLLELPTESGGDDDGAEDLHKGPARVELREVYFSVGGRPLFENASLTIEPGARMTLLGPAESGKTLLLELLYGMRRADRGQILVDGIDSRELSRESLRARIAIVRGPEVLPGSVIDNVRLGRADVSPGRVRKLLDDVGLLDELGRLPEGLDTELGPGGARLTDSQAFRLTLARAMAREPGLLAIDTDLSAVDSTTLERVVAALDRPSAPWSLIVVGDHPQTLALCDEVVHLERAQFRKERQS